jgi:hypothetical protein
MTVTLVVSNQVAQQLAELHWTDGELVDEKLTRLLEAELRRRLARYGITDRQLRQKYGMGFEEFEQKEVSRQKGYTWEVESDAIAWETAVDGMDTVQRQLRELMNANE